MRDRTIGRRETCENSRRAAGMTPGECSYNHPKILLVSEWVNDRVPTNVLMPAYLPLNLFYTLCVDARIAMSIACQRVGPPCKLVEVPLQKRCGGGRGCGIEHARHCRERMRRVPHHAVICGGIMPRTRSRRRIEKKVQPWCPRRAVEGNVRREVSGVRGLPTKQIQRRHSRG